MTNPGQRIGQVEPDVIERACGGWLAIAPRAIGFSIGVTAPTEVEARAKFGFVLVRWLELVRGTESLAS